MTSTHITRTMPAPREVGVEWIDGILLALAFIGFTNIIFALVMEDPTLFRILPCWIILASIALTQRHLENQKAIIILGGTLLCYGSHQLMYLKYANLAVSSKIMVSLFLVYIPLLAFFVLLTSTKSDNLRSQRDQLQAVHTRLRGEANDWLNRLNDLRSGGQEPEDTVESDNDSVKEKKAAFRYHSKAFEGIMNIRFKRDIPNLIENLLKNELKIEHGVIYEAPETRNGDFKIRNIWGVGTPETSREKAAPFRKCDITRHVSDKRQSMNSEELMREPNLYEDFDNFSKELFVPQWVFPVANQDASLFVIYTGKQKANHLPKYTGPLIEPLLTCSSQAIVKLSNKETRPSFSTFNS